MKIDCSKTIDFYKEVKRMCDKYVPDCAVCPLDAADKGLTCHSFIRKYSREAIEIVQKWSDEHPQKTRFEDLLEKYPNADTELVIRDLCVGALGYPSRKDCAGDRCEDCWNMPV